MTLSIYMINGKAGCVCTCNGDQVQGYVYVHTFVHNLQVTVKDVEISFVELLPI